MFEVRCISPLDDEWEERDETIKQAAGMTSYASGAAFGLGRGGDRGERDFMWKVETMEEASSLVARLNEIPLVTATLKEETTYQRHKKKFKK